MSPAWSSCVSVPTHLLTQEEALGGENGEAVGWRPLCGAVCRRCLAHLPLFLSNYMLTKRSIHSCIMCVINVCTKLPITISKNVFKENTSGSQFAVFASILNLISFPVKLKTCSNETRVHMKPYLSLPSSFLPSHFLRCRFLRRGFLLGGR